MTLKKSPNNELRAGTEILIARPFRKGNVAGY